MLGQRVNNFEIVRLLGEGGMGAVYEAKHPLIDKRVAIKVLKPELALDAELVQRFFTEARATSAIRHANIVEVIDLGQLPGGTPYLVMELLEGESLGQRLDRVGRLELPLALDFARQAASALEAAHARGIIHRDLKPDNLFLVPDPRLPDRELVKVLDFGIAKLRGEPPPGHIHTVAGAVLGTPPYMSPEQCRGVPEAVDHRTDIYALGIILYEMLCGHTPFEGEGLGDVMMLHMSAPPPPPSALVPELPPHLEQAILRALAKKPEQRFSSMAELRAALESSATPVVLLADAAQSRVSTLAFAVGSRAAPVLLERARPRSGTSERRDSAQEGEASGMMAAQEPGAHDPDRQLESETTMRSAPPPVASVTRADADGDTDPAQGARARVQRRQLLWLALAGCALVAGAWWWLPALRAPAAVERDVHRAASTSATATPTPRVTQTAVPAGPIASPGAPPVLPPVTVPTITTVTPPVDEQVTTHAERAHEAASTRRSRRREENAALAQTQAAAAPGQAAATNAPPSERGSATAGEGRLAVGEALPSAAADAKLSPGYLSLDSSPWANVYLGAKLLGTTPLMRVELPPGKHVLTLQNPELGASTSYVVEIKSGGSLSRLVGWEKK